VTSLRGVIAIKSDCFRYKGKTMTSLRDIITIKICCLCFVGNTINAKNWLIVYNLHTNTKKMHRV